jgi:hypothetical protein
MNWIIKRIFFDKNTEQWRLERLAQWGEFNDVNKVSGGRRSI